MRETCKKEDIKAFLTLKIKKYYTLWKMADSFVKNISALFLQGFEIGFKKTLERGKYMKKENGVTKQVGKKLNFWQKLWKYRVLTLMCVPAMIFFFAFNYMPLPGIYVAFVKYNYRDGIFGSKFVGLQNFEFLWESGKLLSLTKNTILYNLAFILLGNLLAVVVAILLNEMRCKWFKKVSQTMMFLPYFISQVLVGFLVFNLLNYDTGFVNEILTRLGMEKWGPYSDPHVWPVLLVIIYLWQQTGYNSVVYFASICGIDAEMIEASKVDGANAFQRIRYILLPSLKPTVIILLLFALGGIVKGNAVKFVVDAVQKLFVTGGDFAWLLIVCDKGFAAKDVRHQLLNHGNCADLKKAGLFRKLLPDGSEPFQNIIVILKKRR